jgi:hypothetical protein
MPPISIRRLGIAQGIGQVAAEREANTTDKVSCGLRYPSPSLTARRGRARQPAEGSLAPPKA